MEFTSKDATVFSKYPRALTLPGRDGAGDDAVIYRPLTNLATLVKFPHTKDEYRTVYYDWEVCLPKEYLSDHIAKLVRFAKIPGYRIGLFIEEKLEGDMDLDYLLYLAMVNEFIPDRRRLSEFRELGLCTNLAYNLVISMHSKLPVLYFETLDVCYPITEGGLWSD